VAKPSFTLIVVPDNDSKVRRYRVQPEVLKRLAVAGAVAVGLLILAFLHHLDVSRRAAENEVLREENLALRNQLKAVRERIDHIAVTLDRVERFDQKLRSLTLLSDPQRALTPMGPQDGAMKAAVAGTSPGTGSAAEANRNLGAKLDRLTSEAVRQEQSLQELQTYFQDQKSLLASTPAIWPTRGWVTSDFGARLDPLTADRAMHAGLDIAAPPGKEVLAPADGTVVFSGTEGAYGNVLVVDHGYGLKTRYGHLQKLLVRAGERIRRGQQIATVGTTGRSTGPHLHYEVRVNGLPENPRKFILED
jgi:murein DD-endopeptidase MepM/ murein hydrolase activator NlpD